MYVLAAYFLGVAIVVLIVALAVFPRISLALGCALLSASWWPANNRAIEGPTLITIGTYHGITSADLLGVVGILAAAIAIVRAPHIRSMNARAGSLAVICCFALVGAAAALHTS